MCTVQCRFIEKVTVFRVSILLNYASITQKPIKFFKNLFNKSGAII